MITVTPIDAILCFLSVIAIGATALIWAMRFGMKRTKTPVGKIVLIGLGLLLLFALVVFVLEVRRAMRKTKEEFILQGAIESRHHTNFCLHDVAF